ncbi:30S ribosomal protein S17e [Nanoarchaeota archaeon]|nr:30S ribosomal protein S17e [Nanoarchaeota archaeon]RLG17510.1 MAG: 30S ribosomal protein S17e [Nanoarchaeota archaeon]
MSRIRTKFIKSMTRKILLEHGSKFTDKFEENKKILDQLIDIPSKVIRNKIAGYITFLKKKGEF